MRLRCDSTHGRHCCSLLLDWLGQHSGDHAAHPKHDLTSPALATWPNDGTATRGTPVQASAPRRSGTAHVPSAPAPRLASGSSRRDPYAYEISDWDLLPDA